MFFGGVGPKPTAAELPAEGRQSPGLSGCPERLTAADAGADTGSATTAKRAVRRHEDQRDQRDPRILTRTPAVRPARTRGLRLLGDCQVASRS